MPSSGRLKANFSIRIAVGDFVRIVRAIASLQERIDRFSAELTENPAKPSQIHAAFHEVEEDVREAARTLGHPEAEVGCFPTALHVALAPLDALEGEADHGAGEAGQYDRIQPGDVHADLAAAVADDADRIVRELVVGRSLLEEDALVESITDRYHGSSQKALAAAVRSAAAKYRDLSALPDQES